MQSRNIPQQVREWLAEVEQNAMADTEHMAQLCDKLDQYADENNNTSIKGQGTWWVCMFTLFSIILFVAGKLRSSQV